MIRIVMTLMVCVVTCGIAVADEYEFFLVESFNPDYPLAETFVNDINEANFGVGSDTFGGFVWEEATGKVQLPYSSPTTLNNLRQVVYNGGFLDLDSGTFTTIPQPSGGYPIVALRHLNDNGVGVGHASHGGPGCEPFDCPFDCALNMVWDSVNGSRHISGVTDLKAFLRVNNSNVAIGQIVHGCDDEQAVVYDLGTGAWVNLSSFLPPLDVGPDAQTIPTDISDAGHVVGTALWGSDPQHGFIWTAAEGFTFLPPLLLGEVEYLHPEGVNVHGQVVGAGAIDTWESGNFDYHAFIWDEQNGMRDLNQLVTLPTNFILDDAVRINDHGWITGYGHFGPGWATSRGFVLKPLAPAEVEGDFDGDGDADLDDFAVFYSCMTGPASGPVVGECAAADLDGDEAVDLKDFLRFQQVFTGP